MIAAQTGQDFVRFFIVGKLGCRIRGHSRKKRTLEQKIPRLSVQVIEGLPGKIIEHLPRMPDCQRRLQHCGIGPISKEHQPCRPAVCLLIKIVDCLFGEFAAPFYPHHLIRLFPSETELLPPEDFYPAAGPQTGERGRRLTSATNQFISKASLWYTMRHERNRRKKAQA